MKIAVISLNQHWRDKHKNLARCQAFFDEGLLDGCDLVIFPEMTLTGFYVSDGAEAEAEDASWSVQQFQVMAEKHQVAIMAGVTLKDEAGLVYNNLIAVDAKGLEISRYRKIHTFSFAGENGAIASGDQAVITPLGDAKILNSICYDLRFPELFSAHADQANLIVNIANWPAVRVEQWKALLRARAIESLSYFIGVNRIGEDGNGLSYEKSSLIFSPLGEALTPDYCSDELDIYQLELQDVDALRQKLPFRNDRKKELYQSWLQKNC